MARTMNPQLFNPTEVPPGVQPQAQSAVPQRKWRELEMQYEALNQKIATWMQMVESKVQQLHIGQKNTNEQVRKLSEQFAEQQVVFQSKWNERRHAESRSQDLIDRHQQLVQNFEARLAQLQKVTNEQELKIRSYQSTYDEILREIRNIKRY